jgi:hypothetical protein
VIQGKTAESSEVWRIMPDTPPLNEAAENGSFERFQRTHPMKARRWWWRLWFWWNR